MKTKYFILVLIFSIISTNAQVAIGKTTVNGSSTLLDFADGSSNTKGIILPAVESLPTSPVNGTVILNQADKKIKILENNAWKNLSDEGDLTKLVANTGTDAGAGVIIGANSSNASGVLVLESANKALILPKIASPETNVQNPYPGMICYDTVSKSMAVYDGKVWSYWK